MHTHTHTHTHTSSSTNTHVNSHAHTEVRFWRMLSRLAPPPVEAAGAGCEPPESAAITESRSLAPIMFGLVRAGPVALKKRRGKRGLGG